MADSSTPLVKKTTRAKKTTSATIDDSPTAPQRTTSLLAGFEEIAENLAKSQNEVEKLEKEIAETKTVWLKEQKVHEDEITSQRNQEEVDRQRDQETYVYETQMTRKKSEDEFEEKKSSWEKELNQQKEQIASEKKELADLRKLVEGFPEEKEKAVNVAVATAEKALRNQFETEKRLFDQQTKSQTEILNLKIASLEAENSRQAKEIDTLKKSLDEVTKEFREVAVRTIDASRPEVKQTPNQ